MALPGRALASGIFCSVTLVGVVDEDGGLGNGARFGVGDGAGGIGEGPRDVDATCGSCFLASIGAVFRGLEVLCMLVATFLSLLLPPELSTLELGLEADSSTEARYRCPNTL